MQGIILQDETLIELECSKRVLIDLNINQVADDLDDDTFDVAQMLHDRLKRESKERRYVIVFLLSHNDQDHCAGLTKNFHMLPQLCLPSPEEEASNKDAADIAGETTCDWLLRKTQDN